VYIDNYLLKDAADILKINYSTAKTILRIFRREKRLKKKNTCRKLIQQTVPDLQSHSRNVNILERNISIDNMCNYIRKITETINKCNECVLLNQQMINNLMNVGMRFTTIFEDNTKDGNNF
jgi:hypothetical protein